MTKKVLLWLDDSVSYLHFGIGLSLKKIHDYKFYGLTSFKKDYDFFSNHDPTDKSKNNSSVVKFFMNDKKEKVY